MSSINITKYYMNIKITLALYGNGSEEQKQNLKHATGCIWDLAFSQSLEYVPFYLRFLGGEAKV